MTDPFATKNAALLRQATEVAANVQRYQNIRADLAKMSVTASSPDGVVTVTVDASGLLTALRIEDRGTPLPGKEVAASVLATLKRAQADLPDRAADVLRSFEDDPEAVDGALADYRERFPQPLSTECSEPTPVANGAWGGCGKDAAWSRSNNS